MARFGILLVTVVVAAVMAGSATPQAEQLQATDAGFDDHEGGAPSPHVAWLGVQQREDMALPAARALDGALHTALAAALAPSAAVGAETPQSPRLQRMAAELEYLRLRPGVPLDDAQARALGVVLGAKVTVRASVQSGEGQMRVIATAAAVYRREVAVAQVTAEPPPAAGAEVAQWAQRLARQLAAKLAPGARRLVESAPADAEGVAAAAQGFLADGQPAIAALQFDRAAALAPREPSHYVAAGRAYAASGQRERARQRLEAAVRLAPDNAQGHLELGLLHLRQGEAEKDASGVDELLRMVEAGGAVVVAPRDYVRIARMMDAEMRAILEQTRRRWEDMERASISPPAMKEALREAHRRSDALARAAEGLSAPAGLEPGSRHRVLAYTLLNQADFALLRYLEQGDTAAYDQSTLARQAAIAQLRRAWDLDAEAGAPTMTAAEE